MAESTLSESEARLEGIKRRAKTMAEQYFLPPDDDIHFLLNLIDALRSQATAQGEAFNPTREKAAGEAMRRACVTHAKSMANKYHQKAARSALTAILLAKRDAANEIAAALETVTPEEGENATTD